MIRAAIVGNCQATVLGSALARNRDVRVQYVIDVNNRGSDQFEHVVALLHNKTDVDCVVSQPISDAFPEISSSKLSSLYGDGYFTMTNIFFTGLHPDLSYFGGFGKRVESPIGDYHSKIALIGFLKRMPVMDCLGLFSNDVYERIGYKNCFADSIAELKSRDDSIRIRFADEFEHLTYQKQTMLTCNHPTSFTIAALANRVIKALTGRQGRVNPEYFSNPLNDSLIWPLYPEIVAAHALRYTTDMLFYGQSAKGARAYTLQEFVHESYARYTSFGLDEMLAVPLGRELSDIHI